MSISIDQKIKDRVKKLLNLANDSAAFDGEIDNALRAARKLMLEHNITERDLETAKDNMSQETVVNGQVETYSFGAHVSTWEGVLMMAVMKLVGTVGCYKTATTVERRAAHGTLEFDSKGNIKTGTKLFFYGPEADARDAADLFEEWVHVIATMARLHHGGCFKGNGRAYAEGFATALQTKVVKIDREERELVIAGAVGTALVLQGARENMLAKQTAAKAWLREKLGINLTSRKRSRSTTNDREAYNDGFTAGTRSEFSRTLTKKVGA